jgi:hypothetical protein
MGRQQVWGQALLPVRRAQLDAGMFLGEEARLAI